MVDEQVGSQGEGGVLGLGVGGGEHPAGRLGPATELGDGLDLGPVALRRHQAEATGRSAGGRR